MRRKTLQNVFTLFKRICKSHFWDYCYQTCRVWVCVSVGEWVGRCVQKLLQWKKKKKQLVICVCLCVCVCVCVCVRVCVWGRKSRGMKHGKHLLYLEVRFIHKSSACMKGTTRFDALIILSRLFGFPRITLIVLVLLCTLIRKVPSPLVWCRCARFKVALRGNVNVPQ